jgi:hypothetical protein
MALVKLARRIQQLMAIVILAGIFYFNISEHDRESGTVFDEVRQS